MNSTDKNRKDCGFPPCGRPASARGLCPGHYKQLMRGEEVRPLRVKVHYNSLEESFLLRVRFYEGCWEWDGPRDLFGHGALQHRDYKGKAHRYSYERFVGPIPRGLEIDHQCRNPRCVRPSHLLAVTHAENLQNRGASRNNTSGFRGVCQRGRGEWIAYASLSGTQYRKGPFETAEDANLAAIELRNELYTNNVSDRNGG